jgi:hypothetical protein
VSDSGSPRGTRRHGQAGASRIFTEGEKALLGGARFTVAKLEHNRFDESWFLGAAGLSKSQRTYIEKHGSSFLRVMDGKTGPREPPTSPQEGEGNKRG